MGEIPVTMKTEINSGDIHDKPLCFVIMPFTDSDDYVKGHFKRVFQDIVRPACQQAGFNPIRGDEVKQSNLIHLDILQKLLEVPMAVCDLSSRNPNVLFELALRQAFDKPVTLIQEVGTPQIFDIAPLRYTEYRRERIYNEVLEDQKAISVAIKETFESHNKGGNINSIVKLIAISRSATLPEMSLPEAKENIQQIILSELNELKGEIQLIRRDTRSLKRVPHIESKPWESLPRINIRRELEAIFELSRDIETALYSAEKSDIDQADNSLLKLKNWLKRILNETDYRLLADDELEILKLVENRLVTFENEILEQKLGKKLK
jgi:hypothetical protein